MSKRRKQIYDFIAVYIEENRFSPSMREITEGVGLQTVSTVKGHLDRMQQDGYIDFEPSKPRTIRLIKQCR